MTTITAIIPTIASDITRLAMLKRSVESALHQLQEGDEIIVAGDLRCGPLEAARELCGRLGAEAPPGASVRFVAHDGGRLSYGHDQINQAMKHARGEWLTFSDDDDVYTSGAFKAIRHYASQMVRPVPMLFRFKSYHGPVYWIERGWFGKSLIGGHCVVVPNLPSLLGHWGEPEGYEGPRPYYEGDWTFAETTMRKWGEVGVAPVWIDFLIAIARP